MNGPGCELGDHLNMLMRCSGSVGGGTYSVRGGGHAMLLSDGWGTQPGRRGRWVGRGGALGGGGGD